MIRIELKEDQVTAVLERLARAVTDMTPAMQEIGEAMVFETGRRFEAGVAPDGSAWAPKSPVTLAAYARRGDPVSLAPLIGPTRTLSRTTAYDAGPTAVAIGSNAIQAAVMQLGAAKGAHGTDGRGHPIPWGNIPARPFLGVSDQDRSNITETVIEWLDRAASGRA